VFIYKPPQMSLRLGRVIIQSRSIMARPLVLSYQNQGVNIFMDKKIVRVGGGAVRTVEIGQDLPLTFIGGPCAIESMNHALDIAVQIDEICKEVGISWIYKSSYDKDCRSSVASFHGLGLEAGLEVLSVIRNKVGVPVTSDFSDPADAEVLGKVVDLVQVPAYLCRQTSILRAAANTHKPVHLKKGSL